MERLRKLFSGRKAPIVLAILIIALGVSLTANIIRINPAYAVDQKTVTQQQRAALYELQNAFTSLADQTLPSVVSITSSRTIETGRLAPGPNDDFFKGFPMPFPFPRPNMPNSPDTPQKEEHSGSGVIVSSDGYILTNNHVVAGGEKVTVTLKDGRNFKGTVFNDRKSDLALIKIDAKNLPTLKLGDSSKVKVGSWAIAVGNPFGLNQTMTVGIVSSTGRQAPSPGDPEVFYSNLIQTDASINPGNSGGPLINIDGEVIGINTLIDSPSGGNVGIGFAIPSSTAKFVLDQLIATGKVTRGYLGIGPADLTPDDQEYYGVKEGTLVNSIEADGPADKAGMQAGDVIIEIGGKQIKNEQDLRDTVLRLAPGKPVSIVLIRDKARKTMTVNVGEPVALDRAQMPKGSENKLGFRISGITPDLLKKYQLDESLKGVIITNVTPGSEAMQNGAKPGMVITRVNDTPIASVEEFNKATSNLKSGDTVRLIVWTKDRRGLITFMLD